MKKIAIIGSIIVVLFAAIVLLTKLSNNDKLADNPYETNKLNQATIDLLDDPNYQNIILPDDLTDKIASGEPTLAYMFSPLCSHCKNFTPKLMPIADELDLDIDQLNVLEFDKAWATYNVEATPTLIYFNNGEEVARLLGDVSEADLRAFFDTIVLN
jgi:thioredoxin 1